MKKIVFALIIVIFILSLTLISCGIHPISMMGEEIGSNNEQVKIDEDLANSLVIITPKGVFNQEFFDSVKEEFDKPVKTAEFIDKDVVEKLSGGIIVDLAMFRNDYAQKIFSRGIIQRLDLTKITNPLQEYGDLPFIKWGGFKIGSGPLYALPYSVNFSGILAKKSAIQNDNVSWDIFWDSRQKGKIGTDSLRELTYIAAFLKGVTFDDIVAKPDEAIEKIRSKCEELVKNEIVVFDSREKLIEAMKNSEIDIAYVNKIDADKFVSENSDYKYYSPEEGMIGWIYSLCIPVRIREIEATYKILNKLYDPKISSLYFQKTGYLVLSPGVENNLEEKERESYSNLKNNFKSSIVFGNLSGNAALKYTDFIDSLTKP